MEKNCIHGLSSDQNNVVEAVFANYPEIEEAILYGSRAKGTHRNGSDVDLTLLGENISLTTLLGVLGALDDSSLPYIFDVSIYDKIDNPDLIEHIDRVGVSVYKR
ncbi:nucleotidyltransferase domain-containing protein [Reichenbachiella sp. MALMAid0571]|uniref:nucleotidyltransferase domain-containing protein n=1 Tax=Reichenbachiella sp. MALMAid0571 TaxID=3143939 RepID=UPI0032DE4A14